MELIDPNINDDALLLNEIAHGNKQAFNILFHKHWPNTYSDAYKRLKNKDDAKDVVQEKRHGVGSIDVNEGDRRLPITFDHVHSEGIDPHVSPDPVRMEVMTLPINKIMIGQLLADSFAFALVHAFRQIFSACGEDPQEAQRGRFFSGCVEEFQHQGAQLGVSHRPIKPSSSGKSSYFFAAISY